MGAWMLGGGGAFSTFLPVPGQALHFGMDSVRFGRVLGIGARLAARTLVSAAEAAAAPNPSGTGESAPRVPAVLEKAGQQAARTAARTTAQAVETTAGLARGGKRFGGAVWTPFVKISSVVWLEVTGLFFGLFLVTALANAWTLRGDLHDIGANHAGHIHLEFSIAMAVVFGYFCVSSFVRAGRRGGHSR